jgi:hypothetical protein
VPFKTLSLSGSGERAYVRPDGTLWMSWDFYRDGKEMDSDFVRVGTETNWANVVVTWNGMAALKSDGSLWKWNFPENSPDTVTKIPPVRVGIHNDWISMANTWGGVVALSADGSLWLWQIGSYENYYEMMPLLQLPKQPEFLGNIFAKPD